jgi:hypothetical protein
MQQSDIIKTIKARPARVRQDKQEKHKDKAKPWKRDDKRERFAML